MVEILTNKKDMTKDQWLKWRNNGIGGSDVSIICGINKYKSALELWMEKKGYTEPKEASEAAYWGNVLEPLIRNEFSIRTGYKVDTINSILKHPDYDFMLANVDGIVTDSDNKKCIFEAKTASAFKQNQWDNDIPQEYMLQIQHYMSVTGYDKTYIAVLIGGNKFEYKVIERDDELITMIIELEKRFWNCVINDIPPNIDGSESCSDLMNKLYPKAKETKVIKLPKEAENLIREYYVNKQKQKFYTEKKDEAINNLKSLLGDNEKGVINENIVTWKNYNSERFDSKKLKADMPDIYNKYLKISENRRFTIK